METDKILNLIKSNQQENFDLAFLFLPNLTLKDVDTIHSNYNSYYYQLVDAEVEKYPTSKRKQKMGIKSLNPIWDNLMALENYIVQTY